MLHSTSDKLDTVLFNDLLFMLQHTNISNLPRSWMQQVIKRDNFLTFPVDDLNDQLIHGVDAIKHYISLTYKLDVVYNGTVDLNFRQADRCTNVPYEQAGGLLLSCED